LSRFIVRLVEVKLGVEIVCHYFVFMPISGKYRKPA
jgi:hypothetical protein